MTTVLYSTFRPIAGTNQRVTTNNFSQSVTVDSSAKAVRICNVGKNNVAYVKIGQGVQTATLNDMPVLPLEAIVIHKEIGENTIAYLHESNMSTILQIQLGDGE